MLKLVEVHTVFPVLLEISQTRLDRKYVRYVNLELTQTKTRLLSALTVAQEAIPRKAPPCATFAGLETTLIMKGLGRAKFVLLEAVQGDWLGALHPVLPASLAFIPPPLAVLSALLVSPELIRTKTRLSSALTVAQEAIPRKAPPCARYVVPVHSLLVAPLLNVNHACLELRQMT